MTGTKHRLKTVQPHFDDVWSGRKLVELRKDDRGFAVGDALVLVEWIDGAETGRTIVATITHRLASDEYLAPGYVALSIHLLARFE